MNYNDVRDLFIEMQPPSEEELVKYLNNSMIRLSNILGTEPKFVNKKSLNDFFIKKYDDEKVIFKDTDSGIMIRIKII